MFQLLPNDSSVNLAAGITAFLRVGGQVRAAHAYGAGDYEKAARYARNALQVGALLAVVYGVAVCLLRRPLIGFFGFTAARVIREAEVYLLIMGAFILFHVVNPICTAVITATGNSRTPFRISAVGLVRNLVLDPVLIFGWWGLPSMGAAGAAVATILAQMTVFLLYIRYMHRDPQVFSHMDFKKLPDRKSLRGIVKIGLPATVQAVMFNGIAMVIGRIIASWGETAVAVQKVGIQVESISYMSADGFAAATSSFMAQNYGAGQLSRSKKGYFTALGVMAAWGCLTTCVLVFLPEPIFRVFITEPEVLPLGVEYLRIVGYSQFFMCLEILTAGAFSAFGRTAPPSAVSIVFTSLRVPGAILLGRTALGLSGVWWSISLSSVCKGVILVALFLAFLRRFGEKTHRTAL